MSVRKAKFKYRFDDDTPLEDCFEFASDETGPSWLATEAAEDYHANHGGWEESWPITIELFDESSTSLGKFTVEREYDPSFYSYKL